MKETFAQAIYRGATEAADTEAGKQELTGLNREQFLASVRAVCDSLDKLPTETNLHVFLLAVSYVRNVLLVTMRENQIIMAKGTGGTG